MVNNMTDYSSEITNAIKEEYKNRSEKGEIPEDVSVIDFEIAILKGRLEALESHQRETG